MGNPNILLLIGIASLYSNTKVFCKGAPNLLRCQRILSMPNKNLITPPSKDFCNGIAIIEIFDLSHNSLETVPKEWLENLTNVREVHLGFNKIMEITKEDFNFPHMQNVSRLDLQNNEIKSVSPSAFKTLSGLRTLLLKHNKISHLDYETFGHLRNLLQLYLDHNQISTIEEHAIVVNSKLQRFKINNNEITDAAFANVSIGKTMPGLEVLNISNNNLESISADMFVNSKQITELFMSNNKLETIENGSLRFMKNLQKLDLSHNNLKQLEEGQFDHMSQLRQLLLNNNNLKYFTINRIKDSKELIIFLDENPWECDMLEKLYSQQIAQKYILNNNSTPVFKGVPRCDSVLHEGTRQNVAPSTTLNTYFFYNAVKQITFFISIILIVTAIVVPVVTIFFYFYHNYSLEPKPYECTSGICKDKRFNDYNISILTNDGYELPIGFKMGNLYTEENVLAEEHIYEEIH